MITIQKICDICGKDMTDDSEAVTNSGLGVDFCGTCKVEIKSAVDAKVKDIKDKIPK